MPKEGRDPTDRDRSRLVATDGGTTTDAGTHRDTATDVAREVVARIGDQDVTFKAAGVAYYAVASFLPLLIVAVAVLSLVGAEDQLIEALRGSVSGSTVDVVDEALTQTEGRGGAGVVGFLVALWGATRIFRGLSTAFDELYDTSADESFLARVLQGVLVLAVLLVAVAVVAAAGVAVALVPFDIPFAGLVWNLLALAALVVGLLPLYYVLPPVDVTVREVLPGAVVGAIGWVLLQFGFAIYAENAGTYAAYGFLGAILLFVVFLFFAGLVLLVGAVVNVVLRDRRGGTAA